MEKKFRVEKAKILIMINDCHTIINFALDLRKIQQPHTGITVLKCFSETLVFWGIEFKNINRITTDEDSNMILALSDDS